MTIVLICMFGGMLLGYLLKNNEKLIKLNDKLTMLAIFGLLFLLGIKMGSNTQIMKNLSSLGLHALIISVSAILGSIVMAFFVNKYFFEKEK